MKTIYAFTFNLFLMFCFFNLLHTNVEGQTLVDFETDSALIDGTVVINDAYSLPEDAGVLGEVMTTNGSGQAEWMSITSPPATTGTYVYMTPYVCGHPFTGGTFPVLGDRNAGQYQTAISITNPAHGDASLTRNITHTHEAIDFMSPPDSIQAPRDTMYSDTLPRFHAFAMTCNQIREMLEPVSPLITMLEGYVIIESDEEIVVSSTYTYFDTGSFIEPVNQGGAGGLGIGNSIDVERIKPVFVPSPPVLE